MSKSGYMDYSIIANEKQELLMEIAVEVALMWNTRTIDKMDLIRFIDEKVDAFLDFWIPRQEDVLTCSEAIQEWFGCEMVKSGIHLKYQDLQSWAKKEKPRLLSIQ